MGSGILWALAFAAAVLAADFSYAYGATGFVAWKATFGVGQAKQAYKSCIEKTNDGSLTSTGALCVFDLMGYTFGAASAILGGGFGVSVVESGVGKATETQSSSDPPTRLMVRDSANDQALLDAFNEHIANRSGLIRGHAVLQSDVHPDDGFAIRTNVIGDTGALHLHTNGSHVMAKFHGDNSDDLARRDFLPTEGHYYQFSGMDGLKVQWHNINHDPNGDDDFDHILKPFVRSNLGAEPILKTADAWDFQVCNKAKTATFFYGKIIFEQNRPGNNYEATSPRGCGG